MLLVDQKIFLENEFFVVDFKAHGSLFFFVMFCLLSVISKQ